METYDIKLKSEELIGLLTESDAMTQLLTNVLNQVLDAQCAEQLKAKPYERSEEREGYRNGYRLRTIYTRVGPLTMVDPSV